MYSLGVVGRASAAAKESEFCCRRLSSIVGAKAGCGLADMALFAEFAAQGLWIDAEELGKLLPLGVA